MKFKDGDEVRIVKVVGGASEAGGSNYHEKKLEALKYKDLGYPLIIEKYHGERKFTYHLKQPNGLYGFAGNADWCDEELEFYNKPMIKNIKDWIKASRRKEPEKSFVEAGILNDNDQLTDTGKEMLMEFVLEQNKEKFNTDVVQPFLKAQKEEKE